MIIGDKTLLGKYPQASEIAKGVNFVTRDFKLQQSLFRTLAEKTVFGRSKKADKEEAMEKHRLKCQETGKAFRIVDVKLEGIYSHSTFKNYLQVGGRFLEYLDKNDLKARTIDHAIKKYGVEYLKDMEKRGVSPYTILQAKSFMCKIRQIEYEVKTKKDPEKGRSESVRSRSFSEERNKDLVEIARATGGRRSDLERLETKDFIKRGNVCVGVRFEGSKGGRDRFSPILPNHQKEVSRIVSQRELQGKDKLFEKVNSHANIHSYRREYAKEIYKACNEDRSLRDYILRDYEAKGFTMKPKDLQEPIYRTRDGIDYDRKSLFITSQSLGHNRLDVVTNNYFK